MHVEERWLGYERQSAHTGMIVRLCMGMCISNTAGVNNEHSFKSSRGEFPFENQDPKRAASVCRPSLARIHRLAQNLLLSRVKMMLDS